jgi:hypothetical protein
VLVAVRGVAAAQAADDVRDGDEQATREPSEPVEHVEVPARVESLEAVVVGRSRDAGVRGLLDAGVVARLEQSSEVAMASAALGVRVLCE